MKVVYSGMVFVHKLCTSFPAWLADLFQQPTVHAQTPT